jgi:hypothetical protein
MDTPPHDQVAHLMTAWVLVGLLSLLGCALAWRHGCQRTRVQVNHEVELAPVPVVQLVKEDGPALHPLLV